MDPALHDRVLADALAAAEAGGRDGQGRHAVHPRRASTSAPRGEPARQHPPGAAERGAGRAHRGGARGRERGAGRGGGRRHDRRARRLRRRRSSRRATPRPRSRCAPADREPTPPRGWGTCACPPSFVGCVGDDAFGREAGARPARRPGSTPRLAVAPAAADRHRASCWWTRPASGRCCPTRARTPAWRPSTSPDDVFLAGGHLHVSGYTLLRARQPAGGAARPWRPPGRRGMTTSVDPASAAPLAAGRRRLVPATSRAASGRSS